MNKVYLLNMPLNGAEFTLYGKGGNGVVYKFKGGNVTIKQPAYFMTSDKYYQDLLESSEIFAQGKVKFDPQTAKAIAEEKKRKVAEKAEKADLGGTPPSMGQTDSRAQHISTVQEAINYCAEVWGEVVKNSKQAKECALAHGSDFPSLKVKN